MGQHDDQGYPDPSAAHTISEFVAILRALKAWCGNPSYERLAKISGVPRSTLAHVVSGKSKGLPALDVVSRFVQACGISGNRLIEWEMAWRRLGAELVTDSHDMSPDIPRQLPLDISSFAGRDSEIQRLDSILTGTVRQPTAVLISALFGTAGVGKTALAVHWAHRIAERFPDGQLYVNLRGFDPSGSVMSAAEAVRGFLDAFGVSPERVPARLDSQAALYRSLLAGKRMLVVLDNARDSGQVRPLLPGTPGCLVVVTSRNKLAHLVAGQGAHPVTLDVMPPTQAYEVLARRLGLGRIGSEPDAVDELIRYCAGLPLALTIVAARAAMHPSLPLAELAEQLRGTVGSLDPYADEESTIDVRAVLSWSYRTLSPSAARLFRLLALHPGPDFATAPVAALAGMSHSTAGRLLAELSRTHLVAEHAVGRYSFHDLLRLYAGELVRATDDEPERAAAQRRLFDHYLHTGYAAALLLSPHREPITLGTVSADAEPERLADYGEALAWFTAENPVLLTTVRQAAENGWYTHAWQLAWTLTDFIERTGHWRDWIAVQESAMNAARHLGDRAAEARSNRDLGTAYSLLGNFSTARRHYQRALATFQELADRAGEAQTQLGFAWMYDMQGHYREGLPHCEAALEIFERDQNDAGQGRALNLLGWLLALIGDHEQALHYCQEALARQQAVGDRFGLAYTLDSLGYVYHQLGRYQQAIDHYRQVVEMNREFRDRRGEAVTLTHLGDTYHESGQIEEARSAWEQAFQMLRELRDPQADEVIRKLKDLG